MEKSVILKNKVLPEKVLASRVIETEEMEWNEEINNWYKRTDYYLYRINANVFSVTVDLIPLTGNRAGEVAFVGKPIDRNFVGNLELIYGVMSKNKLKLHNSRFEELGKTFDDNQDMYVSVKELQEKCEKHNKRIIEEIKLEKDAWKNLSL